MGVYEFLKERGLIYQTTHEEEVRRLLNEKKTTFYLGVDPTADSMHLGHFCSLMIFRYLQEAGHKGILLFGGATAMIGDPSGRQDLRSMISRQQVDQNMQSMIDTSARFIRFSGNNPAKIVNNNDWISKMPYVDFLRDYGTYFTVNVMLAADAYQRRIEEGGLTFLEMGYMPIQAADFEQLALNEGCQLQIGGSDQWGNIVAGVELMRRKHRKSVYAVTTPLLLNSEGQKMGKTAKGAVWIDPKRMSPYEFYQYFINVPDADVPTLLKWFTKMPVPEINKRCKDDIITAKKIMAFELTNLVHGEKHARDAEKTSTELFSGGVSKNMPTIEFSAKELKAGVNVCELLERSGITSTRSEARRLIEQGGVVIDDETIRDVKMQIQTTKALIIKRGKKNIYRLQPKEGKQQG